MILDDMKNSPVVEGAVRSEVEKQPDGHVTPGKWCEGLGDSHNDLNKKAQLKQGPNCQK